MASHSVLAWRIRMDRGTTVHRVTESGTAERLGTPPDYCFYLVCSVIAEYDILDFKHATLFVLVLKLHHPLAP